MNTEMVNKSCPFCGQLIVCEEDADPARRCRCADAIRYSADAETLEDMEDALNSLFGENCAEVSKVFVPIGENQFSILHNVVVLVAAVLFTKANITLSDGSVCTMKKDAVNRKVTVQK